MDGSDGHGGGGGGDASELKFAATFAIVGVIVELASHAVQSLGQSVYEHIQHVHVSKAMWGTPWGWFFSTIGLAVILCAVGGLWFLVRVFGHGRKGLVSPSIAIIVAAICGLVVAPYFEAKVIEGSPGSSHVWWLFVMKRGEVLLMAP